MNDAIKGWQCIGCGRIEVLESCIGVCQDRPVELVYADDHRQLQAEYRHLEGRARRLEAIVRQMALSTPHEGAWEESFNALKTRALEALNPALPR